MTAQPAATPAPAKKPRSAAKTLMLRLIPIAAILILFGAFVSMFHIPVPSVTGCLVEGHGVEPGGKGSDSLIVESSCGDYHTAIDDSEFEIGSTYDFDLRGIWNTNITAVTPSA